MVTTWQHRPQSARHRRHSASPHGPVLLLLPFLLLSLTCLDVSSAQTAPTPSASPPSASPSPPPPATPPSCPFTGLQPSAPSVSPSRCPAAANLSCCPACSDLNGALQLASANMSALVAELSPGATVDPSLGVCKGFEGQQRCLQLLEDLNCASSCNSDSGAYISGTSMRVCSAFASTLFDACSPVWMDTLQLSQLYPDASSLLASFASNVTKILGSLVTTFAIDDSSACFNGTGIYPQYTACCDPYSSLPSCPVTSLDPSKYQSVVNRTIDSNSCMGIAPPPPPPAPAPAPASLPSAPPSSPPPPVSYPICPVTGNYPSIPALFPPSRCPAAANLSCCPACSDLYGALQLASANMSALVAELSPGATVDPSLGVCNGFEGQQRCLQLLEDLNCASSCNPNSGAYISGTTMRVCTAFADAFYTACSPVWMNNVSLSALFPNASSLLTSFGGNMTKLMGSSVTNLTIDESNSTSCFNGTGVYPTYTACCDPLAAPSTCPATALNPSNYPSDLINRTIDSQSCMGSLLPPPPPPDAPPSAPAPSSSAPGSAPAPASSATPLPPPVTTFPKCPFTNNSPYPPGSAMPRCPAAANLSCCTACQDIDGALKLVTTKLEDVVKRVGPANSVDASLTLCDLYSDLMCEQSVEDMVCALTCNPDAGRYVSVTDGAVTMAVCPSYASFAYGVCKGTTIGNMTLESTIPDAATFLSTVVSSVIGVAMNISSFNITVQETSCFNGSPLVPATPACCDPLSLPSSCPLGAIDPSKYPDTIGRTINSSLCLSASPPPPPPASAPSSSSSPPAPSAPGSAPSPLPAPAGFPSPSPPAPAVPSSPEGPLTGTENNTRPPPPPSPPSKAASASSSAAAAAVMAAVLLLTTAVLL
ncbi:unnamed protein product [Closterium sp. Naga37s-1]|nr:unnamed protein product [Closterium sp. Naga37s-1]